MKAEATQASDVKQRETQRCRTTIAVGGTNLRISLGRGIAEWGLGNMGRAE